MYILRWPLWRIQNMDDCLCVFVHGVCLCSLAEEHMHIAVVAHLKCRFDCVSMRHAGFFVISVGSKFECAQRLPFFGVFLHIIASAAA